MALGDLVQSAAAYSGSANSRAPDFTGTPVAGNLLLVACSIATSGKTITAPDGWNAGPADNSGSMSAAIFWKESAGNETAAQTFSWSGSSACFVAMLEIDATGLDLSALAASNEDTSNTGTVVTSQATGSASNTEDTALALAIFCTDYAASSWDSGQSYSNGFTELGDTTPIGTVPGILIAKKVLSATGSQSCTLSVSDTGTAAYGAILIFQEAASSGATGTLDATETGSDTAALAGDVLVDGALAATESGADTAALAGDVLIDGALAATESGADTASFAGAGIQDATGALDATESGSDTAALAGDVLIDGALDATESGADTAALAGDVLVSGALGATEVGADTAAISGDAVVLAPSGLDADGTSASEIEASWNTDAGDDSYDVRFKSTATPPSVTTQDSGVPWQLERIYQGSSPSNTDEYEYRYTGDGVRIYVVDSGVRSTHTQLSGRIVLGVNTSGSPTHVDDVGHGTAVAGAAAASVLGVAKGATIVSVKITWAETTFSDYLDEYIAGLEWILSDAASSGARGVVTCSTPPPTGMDSEDEAALVAAWQALHDAGLVCIQCAMNDDEVLSGVPYNMDDLIIVGGTESDDAFYRASNHGALIDINAPAYNVAVITAAGDSSTSTGSGTSYAAPMVAGVCAMLLEENPNASPARIRELLIQQATSGAITGVPANTVNLLLFSGATATDWTVHSDVAEPYTIDALEPGAEYEIAVRRTVDAETSEWSTSVLAETLAPITGTLAATETGGDVASLIGGAAIDGALEATETGADTASIAGQVFVSGALAANESGSDTAALAGDVLVSGELAVAESGADTASIAGTVPVSGALDATETGSDTASLSGAVSWAAISGALAAEESGADVAALAGTVLVQGALAAVETGADTASISSGSIVTGSLAATESGADVVEFSGNVPVTGSVSASESVADQAAFAGDVLIVGTLDATESGADVAAILGTEPAGISGELAASEAGSDTAAMIGQVLVSGTADVIESLDDTAALVGKVLVSGDMAATESGADSAIFTSAGMRIGSLAAVESGSDTAVMRGHSRALRGARASTWRGRSTQTTSRPSNTQTTSRPSSTQTTSRPKQYG